MTLATGQQDIHQQHMAAACELALQGITTTTPNPAVGCVIVKNGVVIGEGYHQKAGEPHAEINALTNCSESPKDATAYVTLEPCAHQGRTGPCAVALVEAGVGSVVYGMEDPNPQVAGKGLGILQNAGVKVVGPVLQNECAAINPGFIKRMRTGLPLVRLKMAMSLDGRTAMANGESQWITGGHARQDVQAWRARSCAIVTGIETVLADDPQLNVRSPEFGAHPRQPLRVIVDSHLRTPQEAQILAGGGTVIATCALVKPGQAPAPTWALPSNKGRVDLKALLTKLGQESFNEVWVECGPTLAGSWVQTGLVDELIVYMAPKLLGSQAKPMMHLPLAHLSDAIEWQLNEVTPLGEDIRLRYARP